MRQGRQVNYGLASAAAVLAALFLAGTALAGSGGPEVSFHRVGESPIDIAVGDFNRDGRQDLAVTNFQGDPKTISILRGRSRGRFARARTIELEPGVQPHGIAVTRLGADKDQDLVVGTLEDSILMFKGRNGAGFETPGLLVIGGNPRRVATGDFNGDGLTDIAASRQDDVDVAVLIGLGGFNFLPPVSYAGAQGGPILAARIDAGNNTLDLLTNEFVNDGLLLYRGQGNGTFAAAQPYLVGQQPVSIAVADLDRDGRTDIIAGKVGNRPRLKVLRGLAGGGFGVPRTLTLGPRPMFVRDIAVTRANRDRDPDLVIVGRQIGGVRAASRSARRGDPGPPPVSRVLFLEGRAGVRLARVRELTLGGDTDAVVTGRFNAGRRPDVAVTRARTSRPGQAVVVLDPWGQYGG